MKNKDVLFNNVMDEISALVEAHWEYLCGALKLAGKSEDELNEIGYHYRSAGIHFAKRTYELLEEKGALK